MKTVLIPIDFSDVSFNAAKFAVGLFEEIPTRFIVFHSFDPSSQDYFEGGSASKSFEIHKTKLNEIAAELRDLYNSKDNVFRAIMVKGRPARHIQEQANIMKADCIAMGTSGASGLKKLYIGSVASNILKHCKQPVIVVPKGAEYKKMNKVVLATDYTSIDGDNTFELLIDIAKTKNASIQILNVRKKNKASKLEEAVGALQMEGVLNDVEHNYQFVEDRSVKKGLNNYIENEGADLLCMVIHKDESYSIIPKSTVEKVSMELTIPLLCLPEKK